MMPMLYNKGDHQIGAISCILQPEVLHRAAAVQPMQSLGEV